MMTRILSLLSICALAVPVQAGELTVEESGQSPDRKITVTSPGVYKAVVYQASGGGINEFYDLASDLGETKDLARVQPAVTARLAAALATWNKELIDPVFPGLESHKAKPKKTAKTKRQ